MTNTHASTSTPAKTDALATFNRITRDAGSVAEALEKAQSLGHLVSPATQCNDLPEGTSVVLSAVLVDVARETYAIAGGGDKVGLGKVALDRIALAAGVSWDPRESRRLDDGRDPRYCAYLAVGTYRQFDGSSCTITGEKELDMRDGSPTVEALRTKYKERLAAWERDGRRGDAPRLPESQIAEVRVHLLSHAASKAKLRAIRGLGIRTSYSKAELAKPFVIAKLTFSGETDDPELRREFAMMRARSFLDAKTSLYGDGPRVTPQLSPARPAPPVGRTLDDGDDIPDGELEEEPDARAGAPVVQPSPVSAARPEQTPSPQPASATVEQTRAPARAPASGFAIPGGRAKGTPLEEASDDDLTYWGGRLDQELTDGTGKPQFRIRNEALVAAIRAEQGRRAGGAHDDFEAEGRARGDDTQF